MKIVKVDPASRYPLLKGEKFGVFNITEDYVESHHRTEKAADKYRAKRQKHGGNDMLFEVVKLEK